MLDARSLAAERRRFLVATRGGIWFPLAGTAFWGLLGVAGFVWTGRTWCLVILSLGVLAVPVAVALLRKLVRRLEVKSPLATLILPAMLPVGLSLGMAAAAFRADPSLVPLALVIGFASHWPAVGWLFGTRVYAVHALVRVGVATAVWFGLPGGRFTVLPLAVSVVYAGTAVFVLRAVRRAREGAGEA